MVERPWVHCMNERRKILVVLGAATAMLALPTLAQQSPRRIGFLWGGSQAASVANGGAPAFLAGMKDQGYIEGRDYVIHARYANGKYESLGALAGELVQARVEVIVTAGAAATRAVQQATKILPVVFAVVNDPIVTGFAQSLARPGGNLTGLSRDTLDISPKHVELLMTIVPRLSRLAMLVNPSNPTHSMVLSAVQSAAQKVGIKVMRVEAGTPEQIALGFVAMKQAQAVIVGLDQFFLDQGRNIAQLALKNRLPTIYAVSDDVQLGGLMSYGPPWAEFYRRSAAYVDKILKGVKPGDIPIEQPTRFELVINRSTAKALGLAITQELVLRADRVIE